MTDQKKHDHWSELVGEVGAKPAIDGEAGNESPATPDDVQSKCDAESAAFDDGSDSDANVEPSGAEFPKDAKTSPRKARPYRPKSGWDDLAQDFDLPPADEPTGLKEEPAGEETGGADDESEDSTEDTTWRGEVEFDALFDDSAAGDETAGDETAGDETAGDETASDETAGGDNEEISFEDAVAAVSKEIEKEKSEEEKQTGRRRKRRRRRPAKKDVSKDDDDNRVSAEAADTEEVAVETGGFAAGLLEEKGSEGAKAGRRRGRRRRGTQRKKDSQKTVVEESLDEAKDALDAEEGAEETDRDVPQNDRADSDREAAQNGRRKRDEENPEEGGKTISHRGIPTWDEAVEHIIAANLEKRSKKTGGGSSQRSRGGRGRGGSERSGSRKRSG